MIDLDGEDIAMNISLLVALFGSPRYTVTPLVRARRLKMLYYVNVDIDSPRTNLEQGLSC